MYVYVCARARVMCDEKNKRSIEVHLQRERTFLFRKTRYLKGYAYQHYRYFYSKKCKMSLKLLIFRYNHYIEL